MLWHIAFDTRVPVFLLEHPSTGPGVVDPLGVLPNHGCQRLGHRHSGSLKTEILSQLGGGEVGYFFLFVIFVRHCPLKVRPLGIIGEELVENLLLVFAEREDG